MEHDMDTTQHKKESNNMSHIWQQEFRKLKESLQNGDTREVPW